MLTRAASTLIKVHKSQAWSVGRHFDASGASVCAQSALSTTSAVHDQTARQSGKPPSIPAAASITQRPAGGATWSDVPTPAKVLGLAGVVPFIALSPPVAASLPLMPAELLQNAALLQVAYGASIASFLGGIHWAMAMAEYGGKQASMHMGTDRYVWSVTPCLMAWPAVVMAPGPASLAIGSVLAVVHVVDGRFAGQNLLPHWYMVLRRPLSAFAISGMLITLVGSFIYPDAQRQQAEYAKGKQEQLEQELV